MNCYKMLLFSINVCIMNYCFICLIDFLYDNSNGGGLHDTEIVSICLEYFHSLYKRADVFRVHCFISTYCGFTFWMMWLSDLAMDFVKG